MKQFSAQKKRRKVNINKINDTPPEGAIIKDDGRINLSSLRGYCGRKQKTAAELASDRRNVWLHGGTSSWMRGHKGQKLGRQLPAKTLEEKAAARQARRRNNKKLTTGCMAAA